ncbi:hypothetical protein ACFL27_14625 [candidate division CSSED10-310 bacterium]|uniref:Carbohydrate ABC transporter permease n=1 Tax=candidate division CSSED10-310 bacterium TaxID=2855610 RepID=A0ABV6YZ13_UNCC1
MAEKSSFWEKWKKIAAKIALVQTYILMLIIYFLIVPFFSLIRFTDPLRIKINKKSTSYWEQRDKIDLSIDKMKYLG